MKRRVVSDLLMALVVLTVAWPDWIETVFRVSPDRGSHALEWGIVIAALAAAVALAVPWRAVRLRRVASRGERC